VALSDRAWLVDARCERDGGRIVGLGNTSARRLLSDLGREMDDLGIDTEALAAFPDGRLPISAGGDHAVYVLSAKRRAVRWFDTGGVFAGLPADHGVEALAANDRMQLIAIPEETGADFGSDGWLCVLERRFGPVLGFSSRVRRFRMDDKMVAGETLLRPRFGRFGNLEGLSVWRDGDGRIRLTMISDDSFLGPLLRTDIIECALPPAHGM